MNDSVPTRLSKIAEFWLLSNGERHSLSQVAPDFVILRKAAAIRRGPAILVIDVEGRQEQRAVQVLAIDHPDSAYISIGKA